MPYDHETFCLAFGMLLGMFYYPQDRLGLRRHYHTGYHRHVHRRPGQGGGLDRRRSAASGFCWMGSCAVFSLYGRQRLATAMLIALALRYPLVSVWGETSLWLGWVVPGLIGADIQRQGVLTTLTAVVAVSIATAMQCPAAAMGVCFETPGPNAKARYSGRPDGQAAQHKHVLL